MNDWIESLPVEKVNEWIKVNGEMACHAYGVTDKYFALWLHYLNMACIRRTGLSFRDLEDWDYWSAFDSGSSPVEACVDMLDDNGYSDFAEVM